MKVLYNPPLRCCPFCGKPVKRVRGLAGLNFFKCINVGQCGAVMSFDNDYYNNNPEQAFTQFNKREHDSRTKELSKGHNDPVGEPGECGLKRTCIADTVRKMHSEIEARCIEGGIYPAFVARVIEQVAKEMMEEEK